MPKHEMQAIVQLELRFELINDYLQFVQKCNDQQLVENILAKTEINRTIYAENYVDDSLVQIWDNWKVKGCSPLALVDSPAACRFVCASNAIENLKVDYDDKLKVLTCTCFNSYFKWTGFKDNCNCDWIQRLSLRQLILALSSSPSLVDCPPALEEQDSLRSYRGAGFLVGLNLDTTSPDTYRPPPAPIPFNVLFGRPQTPVRSLRSPARKYDPPGESADSGLIKETAGAGCLEICASPNHLKKPDSKTLADILLASPTKSDELPVPKEPGEVASEEEDVCPICLEEYDAENPKVLTNCEHDFHLSCILDWMERSDSCPVCDKEMIFDRADE
ncbi:Probable E3 ubiquitin-protein ligase rhb1a [Dionaea muscipula]